MRTDEDYLKMQLYSLNMELDEVKIQRRIKTMEFNTREELLNR
jgi:hypothetical protein